MRTERGRGQVRRLAAVGFAVWLVAFAAGAGNSGNLDNKTGWRDATWGSAPVADAVLVEGLGAMKVYRRKSDVMRIGDYQIDDVLYVYAKDQLYSVIIRTTHPDAAHGLFEALQEAYGRAFQPDTSVERYHWDTRKVGLVYSLDEQGNATIVYTYMPLDDVRKEAEQEAVQKAAKELL